MGIGLLMREIYGMPLDKTRDLEIIDKIIDVFSDTFGKDIIFVEKQVALEHMGWFRIIYRYHPLEYDIIFENDRGLFCVDIFDNEGANNSLYRIEKFDNVTTVENAQNAAHILKNTLQKNDFCFYISRDGKLYRKKDQQYKRIKNIP